MFDFPPLPFLPTFRSRLKAVAIGLATATLVVSLIVLAFAGEGYGSAKAGAPPIKIGGPATSSAPIA